MFNKPLADKIFTGLIITSGVLAVFTMLGYPLGGLSNTLSNLAVLTVVIDHGYLKKA